MSNLILAAYTFPTGTPMPGVIVRGYASGRYVGNATFSTTVVFGTQVNLGGLLSYGPGVMPQAVNIPLMWTCQVYFYFSNTVPDAGVACSVGSSIRLTFSQPSQQVNSGGFSTGGQIISDSQLCNSNPYNFPVPAGQQTQLSFGIVNGIGSATDTWEVHTAYLEAL